MDNPFLYEILIENKCVMGILLTIDSQGILAQKIQTHEQIDALKATNFHKEFSNSTPQHSPIILGVFSLEFDKIVSSLKKTTHTVSITDHETVWLISNACKIKILNSLHTEPELFLVDGHHRLNALQTLKKPIVAWIVSMDKLFLTSFIKVYRCKDSGQIMSKINKKFNFSGGLDLHLNAKDKQIHVYSNACTYQLQINNTLSFVEQLCEFNATLIQEKLELHMAIEYHPQKLNDLINNYKTDYIITTHSALNHDEIRHHQLLPTHTTCFHPKPAENSLLLFNSLNHH